MKTTFAILFSLLLTLTQVVSLPVASDSSAAKSCACSGCQRSCCIRREAPASQPATPAPPSSSVRFQILFTALTQLPTLVPEKSVLFSTATGKSTYSPGAVPLFQRNCSYLI